MANYSENIKTLRNMLEMTQEDFGNALGVTKITISQYESGIRSPSEKTSEKMANLARKKGISVDIKYRTMRKFENILIKA